MKVTVALGIFVAVFASIEAYGAYNGYDGDSYGGKGHVLTSIFHGVHHGGHHGVIGGHHVIGVPSVWARPSVVVHHHHHHNGASHYGGHHHRHHRRHRKHKGSGSSSNKGYGHGKSS
ncbi:spore coat protein YeeK-like [Mytilus edulis]|uniref:spore coat protein YeeK-like n=1 Tax=Mytilus edulis TaxID=6550 RepID=UPI0039F127FA